MMHIMFDFETRFIYSVSKQTSIRIYSKYYNFTANTEIECGFVLYEILSVQYEIKKCAVVTGNWFATTALPQFKFQENILLFHEACRYIINADLC